MIKKNLNNFYILTRKNKNRLLFLFFLMIISIFFDVVSIGAIFPFLNELLGNNSSNFDFFNYEIFNEFVETQNRLLFFSIIIFIFFFLKNIFLFIYQKISSNFLSYLTVYHQEQMLKNYTSKDYSFFLDKKSSEFIREFQGEIKLLNSNFIQPIMTIILNSLTITGFLIFLFLINPKLVGIIILIALAFILVVTITLKKRFIEFGNIRRNENFKLVNIIKQIFEGIRELKIYNKENIFFLNLKKILYRLANASVNRSILGLVPKLILEVLLVLFFILSILISNDPKMLIATLGVFAAALFRIMPNINSLVRSYQQINFSQSAMDDLIQIFNDQLDNTNEIFDKNIKFEKNIKLENISFSYDTKYILKNLNLTIKKNSIIGIKGDSGSGKSTFVDLFVGLLKPDYGKILIDDTELDETDRELWKNKISYIQQNPFIFNQSLEFNISMENNPQKRNYKKINEILNLVNLDNFAKNLENSKSKYISEAGLNISGGQAQRLAIARALYNSSEIIIFDESLNSLDEKNRNEILELTYNLSRDNTIIIISHDDNAFKYCNQVYEIKNKQLIEL